MSKVKNGGLDQYGAEPFEQQQFGTAGVEGVKPAQLTFKRTIIRPSDIAYSSADLCLITIFLSIFSSSYSYAFVYSVPNRFFGNRPNSGRS